VCIDWRLYRLLLWLLPFTFDQRALSTAAAGFKELNEMLQEKRARLFLACLHPEVEEMLARAHALDNVMNVP
jgi:hypothetical protein